MELLSFLDSLHAYMLALSVLADFTTCNGYWRVRIDFERLETEDREGKFKDDRYPDDGLCYDNSIICLLYAS